jgi:peroxiredoxin
VKLIEAAFNFLPTQLCSQTSRDSSGVAKAERLRLGIRVANDTKTTNLSTGQLIPNFRLPAANRPGQLGPWDYKQHRNLVLIFFRSAECRECKELLRQIAERYGDYKQKEAEVLAISTDEIDRLRQLAQDVALPFPLLADNDGRVTELYLKATEQVPPKSAFKAAIFVADRWGAIFTCETIEQDHDLPAEAEIREWVEFIELQCEECFPPEWPQ